MKHLPKQWCWWGLVWLVALGWSRAGAVETLQVQVNPRVEFQTMDGFGASDAWACQFVGENWPLAKRERIADWLFSQELDSGGNPRGIGLSLWRFNITAGTAEQGKGSDIPDPWRRGECFLQADGHYDWSKQAGQQWFLQAARQRGVEKFLAFLNSPPVYFTRNGKGYAPPGITNINLGPGKMEKYSEFMTEVLAHFEQQGLHFDYLSPFNEPQWSWDDHTQEGTPALNLEEYDLIRYLSRSLSQRGLKTQLAIGEAGSIGHAAIRMEDDGRDRQAEFFFPAGLALLRGQSAQCGATDFGARLSVGLAAEQTGGVSPDAGARSAHGQFQAGVLDERILCDGAKQRDGWRGRA